MARRKMGGTKLWCPHCEDFTICRAVGWNLKNSISDSYAHTGAAIEFIGKHGFTNYFDTDDEDEINEFVKKTKNYTQGGARWVLAEHSDIQWFGRLRQCRYCSQFFTTAEIPEYLVHELGSLRSEVVKLRNELDACKSTTGEMRTAVNELTRILDSIDADEEKETQE